MPQDRVDPAKRVQAWVRERFRLDAGALVMVGERPGSVPGGPPRETLIVFWPPDGQRRHIKVFKPTADLTPEDLPPWWMLDALVQAPAGGCDCC